MPELKCQRMKVSVNGSASGRECQWIEGLPQRFLGDE